MVFLAEEVLPLPLSSPDPTLLCGQAPAQPPPRMIFLSQNFVTL